MSPQTLAATSAPVGAACISSTAGIVSASASATVAAVDPASPIVDAGAEFVSTPVVASLGSPAAGWRVGGRKRNLSQ